MNIAYWRVRHAGLYGDQIGMVVGQRLLTNTDLHTQSCRLARGLLETGARPGDRVAISVGNAPELFVCADAVFHAGMVLVLLPEAPAESLAPILNHCGARVLIDSGSSLAALPGASELQQISIASGAGNPHGHLVDTLIAGYEPLWEPVTRAGSDAALITYTGGTTDAPKGAVFTHASLDAFLQSRVRLGGNRAAPILLAVPPTAFGGRFIPMRGVSNQRYVLLERFEAEATLRLIEEHRIEAMAILPTMAEQLIAVRTARQYDCSSLSDINMGGAHVPASLVSKLKERFAGPATDGANAGPRILVHYGMTETGGGIASSEAGGDGGGGGPVGRVIGGCSVRIADEHGEDVAEGQVGEVVARTPYAASGYWNDPERSAAVFRDGWVFTGDLGILRQGELSLVGRSKELIIQGGVKVLPHDVIHAIEMLPGIGGCAVVGVPDELLGEEVVACVTTAAEARVTDREVLARCRAVLDSRKCPGQVLFFTELPQTALGKYDLNALKAEVRRRRAEAQSRRRAAVDSVAVNERSTFVHAAITQALGEVADGGADGIADETPFGERGLDSLGAVRFAHRLSELLAHPFSATLMYAAPTVARLTAHISGMLWTSAVESRTDAPAARLREPIAIVGIGCRVPGARGVAQLWQLLRRGEEAIREAPEDRWPSGGWRGGFLEHASHFDARFFGLEAHAADIDPRHRILLEVAWEACEDAGLNPLSLPPERTGVFLGISGTRYVSPDPIAASPGMSTGYLCQFFDLRGPALAIDTTCSSSLVALHEAVGSLRHGECDVAIAGGVNLLDVPAGVQLGIVSPEGRTRAFDAAANGFAQGEGSVILLLERLADAVARGDRVYATITGTAINHDGRSASLTAPNPHSQANVIRRALQVAGVTADSVQYVEAHGTGTRLGDPIEIEALSRVFAGRDGLAVTVGSIKTNMGHLEAAAGAAGVAKAALSIAHGELPPSLHFTNPNPLIPWGRIPVEVQSSLTPWPNPNAARIAGVSSFGMSGTNAHVILGEPPESSGSSAQEPLELQSHAWVLPLSAKSPTSLLAMVRSLESALDGDLREVPCGDIAYSASCRRAHHRHRIAVVGATHSEWIAGLRRIADKVLSQGVDNPKLVMAFGGQGTQWPCMGRELLAGEPVFREAMEQCGSLIERHAGWQLLEELSREGEASRLDCTEVAQPVIFAFQIALAQLWRSWGIAPAAVLGHSLGEIAASCVAGALTLEQGAQLVCERGRLIQQAAGDGAMLHVGLGVTEAEALCHECDDRLEVAAVNAPQATTLSGDSAAVARARDILSRRGVATHVLSVRRAFHSRHMDDAAAELPARLSNFNVGTPTVAMFSTVTGGLAPLLDAAYWGRQIRAPVLFSRATRSAADAGFTAFLEVDPRPVLEPLLRKTLAGRIRSGDVATVASFRRAGGEQRELRQALGELYCAGLDISWAPQFSGAHPVVRLPTYRWDHAPYWREQGRTRQEIRHQRPTTAAGSGSQDRNASAKDVSPPPGDFIRDLLALHARVSPGDIRSDASVASLGIDSLDFLRVRSRLATELKIDAQLAASFDAQMSVGDWIARAAQVGSAPAAAGDGPSLVTLKSTGAMPRHVWVHPVGGGVDCYRALADALPFQAAAFGMQLAHEGREDGDLLCALASRYVAALLERWKQPAPLILGGWSFGGLVAYEMAVQLRRRGQPVALLVLIDSALPGTVLQEPSTSLPLFPAAGSVSTASMRQSLREWIDPEPAAQSRTKWEQLSESDVIRLYGILKANLAAARSYQPHSYEGAVLSFVASRPLADCRWSWREVAPSTEIELIEADHYSILQSPGVQSLARAIQDRSLALSAA